MIWLWIVLGVVLAIIVVFVALCYFISRTVIYLDRQPVPKSPKDYGMAFQNIEFETADKVRISGWLLTGSSNKLIVMTHVGGLTKYGSTSKFRSRSKLFDEEVEFLKVAKHLVKEGYWVLMFDFRNHGESGRSPNGGKATIGLEESLDVAAAMDYISENELLRGKDLGFVSFCMGANSTIVAMSRFPDKFRNAKCMVAVQPISMEVFVRSYAKARFTRIGAGLILPLVIKFVDWQSKYPLRDMSPARYVKDIKAPTLYVQTREDPWTVPSDITGFFENTRAEKDLYYLEGLTHRFQGYQYFGDHPEKMLWWFNRWL